MSIRRDAATLCWKGRWCRGEVGAGKLAVRGGKAAVERARESDAEISDFDSGTPVCRNAAGGYYAALETEDGDVTCLPQQPSDI